MASISIGASERASGAVALSASTVDTVTFTGQWSLVDVFNIDGAAAIYYTTDGSTPTVGGKSTNVLPAAITSDRAKIAFTGGNTVVKLISVGTPTYVVQGV